MTTQGANSSGNANELGILEILVLVIFGLPTLMSIALVWAKGFRNTVVHWLAEHQLLTRQAFVEIPGTQGFGPTIRGAILAVGVIILLIGIGALGVAVTRQRIGTRAAGN